MQLIKNNEYEYADIIYHLLNWGFRIKENPAFRKITTTKSILVIAI